MAEEFLTEYSPNCGVEPSVIKDTDILHPNACPDHTGDSKTPKHDGPARKN